MRKTSPSETKTHEPNLIQHKIKSRRKSMVEYASLAAWLSPPPSTLFPSEPVCPFLGPTNVFLIQKECGTHSPIIKISKWKSPFRTLSASLMSFLLREQKYHEPLCYKVIYFGIVNGMEVWNTILCWGLAIMFLKSGITE